MSSPEATPSPSDLATREQVERALADGSAIVLDVMEPPSFRTQHIPGAWNLPLSRLPHGARSLLGEPGRPLIVYCGGFT